jgi:hypothetical protein
MILGDTDAIVADVDVCAIRPLFDSQVSEAVIRRGFQCIACQVELPLRERIPCLPIGPAASGGLVISHTQGVTHVMGALDWWL